jgi:hypothetical protein
MTALPTLDVITTSALAKLTVRPWLSVSLRARAACLSARGC